MNRREKFFLIIGLALIVIALLVNEWSLAALFSRDGVLEPASRTIVRIAGSVLIVLGALTVLFRRRQFIANVYLLLFTVLLCLAAVEIYLRVPGWIKHKSIRELRRKDDYLHHTLKPNVSSRQGWGDKLRIMYHTNSLGFRDLEQREVSREPVADRRILLLGDSFVEGSGVEYRDHFAHKLESRLRESGRDIEVLNGGVASYCPSLEFRKLKRFLEAGYQADEVILMLDISDIHDESKYVGWEKSGAEEFIMGGLDVYPRLFTEIKRRLLSRRGDDEVEAEPDRFTWTESVGEFPHWVKEGLSLCKENILKIAELCREQGMKFSLVIYPHPEQLKSGRRPSPHQVMFSDFARENGILIYDLFPDFFSLADWEGYFIPGDIHWNEDGHARIAEMLYNRLK